MLGQIPVLALLVAALLGLVVGPLADRFGHRLTLLLGVAASSVGAFATALAPSLLVLAPVAQSGAIVMPALGLLTLGCNLLAAACLLPARR